MELRYAPTHGDFTFVYKGQTIYVPVSLNDIARHKPKSFWDWLLYMHPFDELIKLTVEHLIAEEKI